jgi:hypothetical protein
VYIVEHVTASITHVRDVMKINMMSNMKGFEL